MSVQQTSPNTSGQISAREKPTGARPARSESARSESARSESASTRSSGSRPKSTRPASARSAGKRSASSRHVSSLITTADEEMVRRITGRAITDWTERFKERLVSDVCKGRLNPSAFYPMSDYARFCKIYELGEDDWVFVWTKIEDIKKNLAEYEPPKGLRGGVPEEVKTVIAIRLHPRIYRQLSGLYGSAKKSTRNAMRKLI